MVLYTLEDCIDSDFNTQMSPRRRKEILGGFKDRVGEILNTFYAFMSSKFQVYTERTAVGDRLGAEKAASLVVTGLLLANPIVEWQRPEEVCKPEHDFLQVMPDLCAIIYCDENCSIVDD